MLDIIRILQIIKKYKVKIILCDPPVFLIHGSTSDVTQCLKRFADSSLLLRIREQRPDSLIMVISWIPPGVSHFVTPLSSASTCTRTAFLVLLYPNAVATSFPTNHDSPSFSIHLRSPNSGLLKSLHLEVEEEGVTNRYPIIFSYKCLLAIKLMLYNCYNRWKVCLQQKIQRIKFYPLEQNELKPKSNSKKAPTAYKTEQCFTSLMEIRSYNRSDHRYNSYLRYTVSPA